jgi:hypothetical protein
MAEVWPRYIGKGMVTGMREGDADDAEVEEEGIYGLLIAVLGVFKNMWEGSRRPFRAHIYSEIGGGLVVVIGGRWWQTIGDVGHSCPW